ncbi:MAG: sialate O-acetylesterase [Akkermansiaceae bacterium]|nr:sialate O-acetylesterase [Akkermansiaceae bacterium]
MIRSITSKTALAFAAMALCSSAVELPRMFSDHGVLQQGTLVPVWGWGSPGENVTVEFAGQKVSGKADSNGEWRVELKSLTTHAAGSKMTVTGESSGTVEVQDLLVGEVWMASGQSNMQRPLAGADHGKEDAAAADFPGIRMFLAHGKPHDVPQRKAGGSWAVCTPSTAGEFSAVGFYFAQRLHQELGVPIGIIRPVFPGKPVEAFTSREGLLAKPEGAALVHAMDEEVRKYKAQEPQLMAAFKAAMASGEPVSRRRRPPMPYSPALEETAPSALYNGMIHAWVGYAMKGAIWYQGESNASRAKQYETIFPQLIEDWRRLWKSDFPFYFVQLANFKDPSTEPGVPDEWAELQNAQRLTLALPKTGMAVINDVGMAGDVHPTNKKDVGYRLARWALAKDYGKTGFCISGPLYKGSQIDGSTVRIEFDHAKGLKSRDGGPLKRFEIAGQDQKWFWADAVMEGGTVVVSNKDIQKPVAVRYAWAANPEGANLVNDDGLPASVFRTDDWKPMTEQESQSK